MKTWPIYTLEDVCKEIYSGGTPSTKHPEFWGGDLKWLSSGETSQKFIYDTQRKITEEGVKHSSTRLANKNSVVIATAGQGYTRGQASFLMTDTYMNQSVIACKPNEQIILPLYLYYNLDSRYEELRALSDGTSTRGGLSGWILKRMKISVPPISEQSKIVEILYSLDRKIEINNQINKNLANQSQAIYRENFDTAIHSPTGIISDICHYSTEKIPVENLTVASYYSTENMQPNKESATVATSLPSVSQTTKCNPGDVLVSNIRPYFKKIEYVLSEGGCSNDVLCFVPESKKLSAFLYETLYANKFFDYVVAGSKGTKMPRGDKQQIMQYPIIKPSVDQLTIFNDTVIPILKLIANNNAQNRRLSEIRDTLLSRLISGEIDISDVDF